MQPNKPNNDAGGAMNKPAAGGGFASASKLLAGESVVIAAQWFAANRADRHGAFIPILKKRFGLTPLQAIEAGKLAHKIEQGGKHVSRT